MLTAMHRAGRTARGPRTSERQIEPPPARARAQDAAWSRRSDHLVGRSVLLGVPVRLLGPWLPRW